MRITLYKLTKSTPFDKTALRDTAQNYNEVPLKPLSGAASAALLVKPATGGEPKWVGELRGLVVSATTLPTMSTLTNGAVLFVQQGEDKFAVTFGNGFQALNPTRIVPGFGLRVTANSIAQAKVKSADTRMLASAGKSQRIMLPEASELTALGIEPLEEWVRQLSGGVADQSFASTAAGADSLRLTIRDFKLAALPDKLKAIGKLHQGTSYKTAFPFIDNFQQLDPKINKTLLTGLNEKVLDRIRKHDKAVFFAAPEPFDTPDVCSYKLTKRKSVDVHDLAQDEVFAALQQFNMTSDDSLHTTKVSALNADDQVEGRPCTLFDCVQAEEVDGSNRYVLSAGQWFRVANGYIQQVDNFLKTVADITDVVGLPAWGYKKNGDLEDEGTYNKRVHQSKGYALLDKKNLSFGGHQKIEVCDLLTPSRQLICVKRATRSSALSHLFAQGKVSASLMYHPDYQAKLEAGLVAVGAQGGFGSMSDWTVVFAIATEKTGPLLDNLFFFSRMNLMTHIQDIQSRGIQAVVARISMP